MHGAARTTDVDTNDALLGIVLRAVSVINVMA